MVTDFCDICLTKTLIGVSYKGSKICCDCCEAIADKYLNCDDSEEEIDE